MITSWGGGGVTIDRFDFVYKVCLCVCVCVYKPLKKVLQLNVDISLCIIILNIGVVRKPTIPLYNDTPFAMIMDSRNVQDKYDVIKREISTLKIELWNFFEGFIYMKEVARGGGHSRISSYGDVSL